MLDLSHVRALLIHTRPAHPSAGYPAATRAAVVALCRDRVAQGWTVNRVARELGLHGATVRAWLDVGGGVGSGFVPVQVSAVPTEWPRRADRLLGPTLATSSPPPGLTLVSPGGYRLEGLDLDSALIALARLS